MTALDTTIDARFLARAPELISAIRRTRGSARGAAAPAPGAQAPATRRFFKYLPECDTADADARLLGAGCGEVVPGESYRLGAHPNLYNFNWSVGRVLPEHQLLVLTDAQGEFESKQTGLVRFHGSVLLFLFPGVWHRFRPLRYSGWTERWVSLAGDGVAKLLREGGVTPDRAIVEPANVSQLVNKFQHLLGGINQPPRRGDYPPPCTSAIELLSEAIQQTTHVRVCTENVVAQEARKVEDEVVQAALDIIWNDTHSPPLGVSDVAKLLPVTRRTLDRRFSESLGRSVLEEINACRFARAQRLLRETDLPIKAVSYLSGFPSRERMRIMFLEREGLPPRDYRDKVQQQRGKVKGG